MEMTFTEGMTVVSSDDHRIGTVAGTRDGCLLVRTGHVFHSMHAIPSEFVSEIDGVLRATVSKEIVDLSPKVDDESFDCEAVRLHYGLDGPFEVDPDPEGMRRVDARPLP
jgi:hypothetical protein